MLPFRNHSSSSKRSANVSFLTGGSWNVSLVDIAKVHWQLHRLAVSSALSKMMHTNFCAYFRLRTIMEQF